MISESDFALKHVADVLDHVAAQLDHAQHHIDKHGLEYSKIPLDAECIQEILESLEMIDRSIKIILDL